MAPKSVLAAARKKRRDLTKSHSAKMARYQLLMERLKLKVMNALDSFGPAMDKLNKEISTIEVEMSNQVVTDHEAWLKEMETWKQKCLAKGDMPPTPPSSQE